MIHLDTNFLIGGMQAGSSLDARLRAWIAGGVEMGISAIAWAEFLCGPLSAEHAAAATRLLPHPEPLLPSDSVLGAALFNATGRRRGSLADCLIAATCMRVGAQLATENRDDFLPFLPHGLVLATEN